MKETAGNWVKIIQTGIGRNPDTTSFRIRKQFPGIVVCYGTRIGRVVRHQLESCSIVTQKSAVGGNPKKVVAVLGNTIDCLVKQPGIIATFNGSELECPLAFQSGCEQHYKEKYTYVQFPAHIVSFS